MKWFQMVYSKYKNDYNDYYHSKVEVKKEDDELQSWLEVLVSSSSIVHDFGCGDGLVKRLLDDAGISCPYIGIDPDSDYKDPVSGKAFKPTHVMGAEKYLSFQELMDVSIFCFSSEDCGADSVERAFKKSKVAMATIRNKAWRTNAPLLENIVKHVVYYYWESRKLRRKLKRLPYVTLYKLRGKNGYYLAVKDFTRRSLMQ